MPHERQQDQKFPRADDDFFVIDLQMLFPADRKNEKIIRGGKYKTVCVNDTDKEIDFEKTKNSILAALDQLLPERSSFEK